MIFAQSCIKRSSCAVSGGCRPKQEPVDVGWDPRPKDKIPCKNNGNLLCHVVQRLEVHLRAKGLAKPGTKLPFVDALKLHASAAEASSVQEFVGLDKFPARAATAPTISARSISLRGTLSIQAIPDAFGFGTQQAHRVGLCHLRVAQLQSGGGPVLYVLWARWTPVLAKAFLYENRMDRTLRSRAGVQALPTILTAA